jgi:type II secretory pathway pseudopilin PulG
VDGHRKGRSRARGFSLIEAMIAGAILTISIVGLARLYTSAARGVAASNAISEAVDVASQTTELFSTMDPDDVPLCAGAVGCRVQGGQAWASELAAVGAFACTRWVDGPAVPEAATGTHRRGTKYRLDAVVEDHPDAAREADARLVTVSVCWADETGRVHEIRLRRMLVPGA